MPGIKDFKNKVVVITGAGSGIGRATALAFAKEGAVLVIADKDEQRLKTVQGEIQSLGAKALIKPTDVSDKEQVRQLSEFVIRELGRVDILHNNAGVSVGGRIEDTPLEDWEWLLGINLWGGNLRGTLFPSLHDKTARRAYREHIQRARACSHTRHGNIFYGKICCYGAWRGIKARGP